MKKSDLGFKGLDLIPRGIFHDQRGYFSEVFSSKLSGAHNLPEFLQDNISQSKLGVIRGLHWQKSPHAQSKLVFCITGSIFDVVVDLRKESDTYLQWFGITLNEDSPFGFWVPAGFAHGFQALSDKTTVFYKVDNLWNQESEASLMPLDPDLKIRWPIEITEISKKDQEAPTLKEIRARL